MTPTATWDSYLDAGPQVLAPGEYTVVVDAATAGRSSSNKPQLKLRLEVIAGPAKGQKLWDQLTFTRDNPGSFPFLFGPLHALGLDRAWLNQYAPIGTTPDEEDRAFLAIATVLPGREAVVTVTQRLWQGTQRNDVKGYRPAGGSPVAGGLPAAAAPAPSPGFPTPAGGFPPPASPAPPAGVPAPPF